MIKNTGSKSKGLIVLPYHQASSKSDRGRSYDCLAVEWGRMKDEVKLIPDKSNIFSGTYLRKPILGRLVERQNVH